MSERIEAVRLVEYGWNTMSPAYRVRTSYGLVFDLLLQLPNVKLRSACCEFNLVPWVDTTGPEWKVLGVACPLCNSTTNLPTGVEEAEAVSVADPLYARATRALVDPFTAVLLSASLEEVVAELLALPIPATVQSKGSVGYFQRKLVARRLRRFQGRAL